MFGPRAVRAAHRTVAATSHVTASSADVTSALASSRSGERSFHSASLLSQSPRPHTQIVAAPARGITEAEQAFLYGRGKEDPRKRPRVDARITAMQVMGSESAVRPDAAPVNSPAERRILEKLDWLREKTTPTPSLASFTTEQVEDLDDAFRSVRFAAPLKMWHEMMSIWQEWARTNSDGDPALALDRIDGYFKDLLATTSQGVWALSREGAATSPYPPNLLRFSLRPNLHTFTIAMRAHAAADSHARVRDIFSLLHRLRASIPDPASEPAPTQPSGAKLEKELLRRRLNAEHRAALAPSAGTYAAALSSALAVGDHAFIDSTVEYVLTKNRGVTLTSVSHATYLESLMQRGMHWAVVEYLRVVLLGGRRRVLPAAGAENECGAVHPSVFGLPALAPEVEAAISTSSSSSSSSSSASTTSPALLLPSFLAPLPASAAGAEPPLSRAPFAPSRPHWMLAFEALTSLHAPSPAESAAYGLPASFPASARREIARGHSAALSPNALAHRARSPGPVARGGVPELDAGVRQWLYDALSSHGVAVAAPFFHAMLSEAPTPAHVVSYVNDLHQEADALHARASAEPATEEETAAKEAERQARFKLIVDLNMPDRHQALQRVFGRYTDAAVAKGILPETYEIVHRRFVDLLVYELSSASVSAVATPAIDPAALKSAFRQSVEAYAAYLHEAAREAGSPNAGLTVPQAQAGDSVSASAAAVAAVTNAAPSSVSAVAVRPPGVPHKAVSAILGGSARTQALLSVAGSPAAAALLGHLMAVRTSIAAYGVEMTAATGTAYLRSLVLAARRAEPLPPLAVDTATSLIPVVIAPVRVRVRGAVPGETTEVTLVSVCDRARFAHNSIARRHAQLQLVIDELEMLEAAQSAAAEDDPASAAGADGANGVDLELYCEVIEALAELGTDAAVLRGPFDVPAGGAAAVKSGNALDEYEEGTLFDTATALKSWTGTALRKMMGRLAARAVTAPPSTAKMVPLLDDKGEVTLDTYMPLFSVLAAHGASEELLHAVAAVHERRALIPTTAVFNLVVIACINGNEPGRALRVLDIMALMSQPGKVRSRGVSPAELSRAITAGDTREMVLEKLGDVAPVFPDEATLSLLLRALHQKGLLTHVEELWRRLAHRPPSSWTSYSAVEEQHALEAALAEQEPGALEDVQLDAEAEALLEHGAASEGEYSDVFNPAKNAAIRRLQTITPAALARPLPSLLPDGACRPLPSGTELLLDAPADTALAQTFIQLGHPMHALQLYLDARAGMPARPLPDPTAASLAAARAAAAARSAAAAAAAARVRALDSARAEHELVPNTNLNTRFIAAEAMTRAQNNSRAAAAAADAAESGASPAAAEAEVEAAGDGLDDVGRKYDKGNLALIDVSQLVPSVRRVPLPREREAKRLAAALESAAGAGRALGRVRPRGKDGAVSALEDGLSSRHGAGVGDVDEGVVEEEEHPLQQYYWPQADMLAAVTLYYQRTAKDTAAIAMKKLRATAADAQVEGEEEEVPKGPLEGVEIEAMVADAALKQAETVHSLTRRVMSELREYSLSHPFVLGDPVSELLYGLPRPGSLEEDMRTCVFSRPSLLVPYTVSTAELYRSFDELAAAAAALEETLFKARAAKHASFGLKRWLAIFPTVANQARGLLTAHSRRALVQDSVDRLRGEIDASIRRSLYARRAALIGEAERKAAAAVPQDESEWVARFSRFLGEQDADKVAQIFFDETDDEGVSATTDVVSDSASVSSEQTSSKEPEDAPVDPLARLMASLEAADAPSSVLTSSSADVFTVAAAAAAGGSLASAASVAAAPALNSTFSSAVQRDPLVWNPLGSAELPVPLSDQAATATLLRQTRGLVGKLQRERTAAHLKTTHDESDALTEAALLLDVREPPLPLQPLRAEGAFFSPYGPTDKGGVAPGEPGSLAISEAERARRVAEAQKTASGLFIAEQPSLKQSPLSGDIDPRPSFLDSQLKIMSRYKSGRLADDLDMRPIPSYHISDLKLGQVGAARALNEDELEEFLVDRAPADGDDTNQEYRSHSTGRALPSQHYTRGASAKPTLPEDAKSVVKGDAYDQHGVQRFRKMAPGRAQAQEMAQSVRANLVDYMRAEADAAAAKVSNGGRGFYGQQQQQQQDGLRGAAASPFAPRGSKHQGFGGPFGGLEAESRTPGAKDGLLRDLAKTVHRGAGSGKGKDGSEKKASGVLPDAWASAAIPVAYEQVKMPKSKVMKVKEKLERRSNR